jgi:hypothetical protein
VAARAEARKGPAGPRHLEVAAQVVASLEQVLAELHLEELLPAELAQVV